MEWQAQIQYAHAVGHGGPLHDLFYSSKHSVLVPRSALSEEIDAYYCSHCLQEYSPAEHHLFKGACSSCFECPRCCSTATLSSKVHDEAKLYFLMCHFCRWNSLSQDLVDQHPNELFNRIMALERDTPVDKEMERLQAMYLEAEEATILSNVRDRRSRKELARSLSKSKRKLPPQPFSKTEEMLAAKENAHLVAPPPRCQSLAFIEEDHPVAATTTPTSSTMPDGSINYSDLAGVSARFNARSGTHLLAKQLPPRKPLLARTSLRYRDRLVLKPEKPPSTQYQINMSATKFLPKVSITLLLMFVNPTDQPLVLDRLQVVDTLNCAATPPTAPITIEGLDDTCDDDMSNFFPLPTDTKASSPQMVAKWLHKAVAPLRVAPQAGSCSEMLVVLEIECHPFVDGRDTRLIFFVLLNLTKG
eukprot:NODE_2613_length_1380_cov_68.712808_g2484_i0.p1 GENE.NODE_2613_length_1380_cov_68.712808_g2484_i0~~NODE_2613_length_1380_cov_68.712808_g2484_i0.p1  ORF type:complete len:417 (+),score=48.68 NODE_2613_length_1380_cov_68.712808_g2484_i0:81-1331(+)